MNPKIIFSIVLSLVFLIILLVNNKLKNKIIKISFIVLSIIFITIIFLLDNNFIYDFLKAMITYIWYPTYLLFVLTVVFSSSILIYTLVKDQNKVVKIENYLFFTICFLCYNIFKILNIDTSLYSSLYQKNSLFLMRTANISLLVWLMINIILRIRGKNEK